MNTICLKKFVLYIILASAGVSLGQSLKSTLAANALYQTGYQLSTRDNLTLAQAKQSLILYDAALRLDGRADYVPPEIINLAWRYPHGDFSALVKIALEQYLEIGHSADLDVASKAVKYLLEKLGTREERQQLLTAMLDKYGKTNPFFASEIATQLGLLSTETADTATAQKLLLYAISLNGTNRLAFNTLVETAQSDKQVLPDIAYLNSLRLAVRTNPLDVDSAYNFSQLAESLGLYGPATAGYKYCVQATSYINPSASYAPEYYRPWALNAMNAKNYRVCNMILQQVRGFGVFDVMIEAVTASAAKETEDQGEGATISNTIKSNAAKILSGQLKATPSQLQDYAWFYAFVEDSNNDALTWATKAYDADNNSISAQAFLAYALVINNQQELAKPMLKKIGVSTQIAAIAQAIIFDVNDNDANAIELLKAAVASSPGTFEAKIAKQMLTKLGSEYVPPVDAKAMEIALANEYGQNYFSDFMPPEKMLTVSLKTSGTAFSYGTPLDTQLAIVNNYTEPLIVGPDSIFKGNVRVDVRISGDLTYRMEEYIVRTVRPAYEIKPGSALFVPLKLTEGKLKPILDGHPQASLNMEITVYVDPQKARNGNLKNIFGTEPVKVIIKRRKLDLDTLYLQQRFDALKNGKQGQKIKSVQLFAGLLAEQQNLAAMQKRYKFLYCEPGLLTSAIAKCLTEDDWVLKVETVAALQNVDLDYRLIDAISEQIDYKSWPVRLIAVFTLAEEQGANFQPVLKWVGSNDSEQLIKDMAAALTEAK
ncbi:MAG: hypothetical protein ABFD79_18830 [Phycisphaerales bacterium]